MARDEQALRGVTEQSAAVLTAAGFPKMPARVLMTLLASDEAGLTALDLAEQLGASPAAISGAVRYLQHLTIVRRVSQSGSRRDRYELPENAWLRAFRAERPIYGIMAGLSDDAIAAIGDPAAPGAQRLGDMAKFFRFLDARLPALMDEWEALTRESPLE